MNGLADVVNELAERGKVCSRGNRFRLFPLEQVIFVLVNTRDSCEIE